MDCKVLGKLSKDLISTRKLHPEMEKTDKEGSFHSSRKAALYWKISLTNLQRLTEIMCQYCGERSSHIVSASGITTSWKVPSLTVCYLDQLDGL
ncbi:hypothetical protein Bealeia2_02059 (plasmid) [Candidatus Bealeia paramacronuclearis]|nr:hypothetical protein [Candidatus Bealeia paramacronuclearis]